MLGPTNILKDYEDKNNLFARLAFIEALKIIPFGAVWDFYCESKGVPIDIGLIDEVIKCEKEVTSKR